MAIELRPLSETIGAEVVELDLREPLDDETIAELRQAWLDHVVLVIRDQELNQEQMIRFTTCFGKQGELSRPKEYRTKGHLDLLPGIMLISNIRENGEPIGALPDGEMMFHHDMLHAKLPHKGTVLYSVEIPSTGGNTLFANCYASYETLSDRVKAALEGRKAFNHYNYGSVQKGDGKGVEAFAESEHPIFRTHDNTGRKAVFVNRLMTEYVVDMAKAESDDLLGELFDHSERSEFVYEHEWRKGDVVLWDNRCSMHARTDFPETERRLMWRTTIEGEGAPY